MGKFRPESNVEGDSGKCLAGQTTRTSMREDHSVVLTIAIIVSNSYEGFRLKGKKAGLLAAPGSAEQH